MLPPICDRFFLFPVTANEIEVEIAKLNASKAVGPSSIPIVILKILKCELSGPLELRPYVIHPFLLEVSLRNLRWLE